MAVATKIQDAPKRADAPVGQLRTTWRRFRKHRLGLIGLVTLTTIMLACIVVPIFLPYSYSDQDFEAQMPDMRNPMLVDSFGFKPAMWSGEQTQLVHPLGTDRTGRDNLARLFHGGRISLAVGLVTAAIVVVIGSLVGALAGFYSGIVDTILMRVVDLLLSLPILPILLVVSKMLEQSNVMKNAFGAELGTVITIIMVLSVFGWLGISRLVRGSVLSLRSLDFVEASRALGASNRRIILRHLLPNSIAPIIVAATLSVGEFIITESFLSFLGLGIREPIPSWGNMLEGAQEYSSAIARSINPFEEIRGYLILFPGLMILLTVLAINFIGDALRDALDPRLKM
ncbi:MAG TPA: ABC transporter permease [Chloroflexia bacterium]|jgi:peptide/nickel transport system permease protein